MIDESARSRAAGPIDQDTRLKSPIAQDSQREGAQQWAPLDARKQRVAEIKKAVAQGTYRIRSEDVAEKLMKTMEDR